MNYSLARILCAVSIFTFTSPVYAEEIEPVQALPLQVSQQGDIDLSCGSLSQEAMTMRDIIYTTQDIKDDSQMKKHGITAAGAVGSFLIGTVTGGVGLAAAGFLLEHNVGETKADADNIQDVAEQRRSLMMGIYNAKGCYGPIEHAMQNPDEFSLIKVAALEPEAGMENETEAPRYNN